MSFGSTHLAPKTATSKKHPLPARNPQLGPIIVGYEIGALKPHAAGGGVAQEDIKDCALRQRAQCSVTDTRAGDVVARHGAVKNRPHTPRWVKALQTRCRGPFNHHLGKWSPARVARQQHQSVSPRPRLAVPLQVQGLLHHVTNFLRCSSWETADRHRRYSILVRETKAIIAGLLLHATN